MTTNCKLYYEAEMLNGRLKIFTDFRKITKDNIGEVLAKAYALFSTNLKDIEYLYWYYRGVQPILYRKKDIRPEINNKIVENHAYSIVQFRTGYLLEKPIQYVARKDSTNIDMLNQYNDFNVLESKESGDKKIANWRAICGTAYRLSLPNKKYSKDSRNDSPHTVSTVSPLKAFVVYSSDIGERPMLGVIILKEKDINGNETIKLQAWTENMYYIFDYGSRTIIKSEAHTYGMIPLIEYPNGEERMGAFEMVLPMLDALNTIQSNRVDGIEQFIQAIMVFKNVEITKEMLQTLKDLGAINISDSGEVKANIEYLSQELNQEQVQKLKSDLLTNIYKICGIPQQNGSGGGNNGATEIHDGWTEAEAKAQEDELSFKTSEQQFIKLSLNIDKTLTRNKVDLSLADIDIKFTRRNYENLTQKVNALNIMLVSGKVAPRVAFATCGLFADPEEAYLASQQYIEEQAQKAVNQNGKD